MLQQQGILQCIDENSYVLILVAACAAHCNHCLRTCNRLNEWNVNSINTLDWKMNLIPLVRTAFDGPHAVESCVPTSQLNFVAFLLWLTAISSRIMVLHANVYLTRGQATLLLCRFLPSS